MHRDDLADERTAVSPQGSPPKCSVCPHWNRQERTCALVKDGLFLPVEQYVQTYCLSSHFSDCSYFQHLAVNADSVFTDITPQLNRRRSIRIPDRHLFRFSEITSSDQISGLRENDAWTVDLSDHGIRFASRQFLPPGTRLEYHLGTGSDTDRIDGQGRVVWSEPLANTPLFHIGIAFDNHQHP